MSHIIYMFQNLSESILVLNDLQTQNKVLFVIKLYTTYSWLLSVKESHTHKEVEVFTGPW